MRLLPILLVCATSAGCAIGNSDFSCQGYPAGASCMSSLEVYEMTHNGVPPSGDLDASESESGSRLSPNSRTVQFGGINPPPSKPVPVRREPVVMRVVIDPYQSREGHLNFPGTVFAEVKGPQWNLGHQPSRDNRFLNPIQSSGGASERRASTIPEPAARVSSSTTTQRPAR